MPSAITAPIHEGKPITAAEFIMRCARQFGGLSHMRDESLNAPIVPRVADTARYDKMIADFEEELEEYKAITLAEAAVGVDADYAKRLASYEKACAEKNEIRARYEAIRDKVEAWEPPTPEHDHLKQFALDQIDGCIEWDCKVYEPPTKFTPEEWLKARIEGAQRSINFYKNRKAEDIEQIEKSNKWVAELVESITAFHNQGLPELKFESLEAPRSEEK